MNTISNFINSLDTLKWEVKTADLPCDYTIYNQSRHIIISFYKIFNHYIVICTMATPTQTYNSTKKVEKEADLVEELLKLINY